MPGPLDRLFQDVHRGAHPGDRFDVAYGLRDREPRDDDGDEPWFLHDVDHDQTLPATIAGLLGIAFEGVIGYFPFGFTIFVAPLAVILAVYAQWLLMLRVTAHQRLHRPWLALAIPLVSVAIWCVMMWFGWTQLGWPPLRMPGLV